jgi:hypothetical protein
MACEEQGEGARKLEKGQGNGRLCTCEPEPRTTVYPTMVRYEMPQDQFAIPSPGRVSIYHHKVSRRECDGWKCHC